MALIDCPDCGEKVSDFAVSCGYCGAELPSTAEPAVVDGDGEAGHELRVSESARKEARSSVPEGLEQPTYRPRSRGLLRFCRNLFFLGLVAAAGYWGYLKYRKLSGDSEPVAAAEDNRTEKEYEAASKRSAAAYKQYRSSKKEAALAKVALRRAKSQLYEAEGNTRFARNGLIKTGKQAKIAALVAAENRARSILTAAHKRLTDSTQAYDFAKAEYSRCRKEKTALKKKLAAERAEKEAPEGGDTVVD